MYIYRQNSQNECGLCCVAIIAAHYGFTQPINFYRKKYATGRDGTDMSALWTILEDIHLKPFTYKIENLNSFKFERKPYIAKIKNNHYVVITYTGRYIQVYDPAKGKYKLSMEAFLSEFDGLLMCASVTDSFKKNKIHLSPYRHLIPIIKARMKSILFVLLLSSISYMVSIVVPILLQNYINTIISGSISSFVDILKPLCVAVILFFLLSTLRDRFLTYLQTQLLEDTTLFTMKHLLNIPFSFFDNRSPSNIQYRMTLLSQIQSAISVSLIQFILSLSSTLIIIVYLGYQYITLLPLIFIVLICLFSMVIFSNKYLLHLQDTETQKRGSLSLIETELIMNMFQIQCMHLSNYYLSTYKEKLNDYKRSFKSNQKYFLLSNLLISTVNMFAPFLLLVIAVNNIKLLNITVGEIVAIYTLLGLLFSYFTNFVSTLSSINRLKSSLFYLNDIYDEAEKEFPRQVEEIEDFEFDSLAIKNLYFKYNDSSSFSLNDINMVVNQNQKIAIIGASGSGKTSIIKLLSNMYTPDCGKILLNNKLLSAIREKDLAKIVSFVPQTPVIFSKNIRENIRLEDDSVSDEKIIDSLRCVNFWDEVQLMPMGLNTMLSSQGGNLSGGQIQKVNIARSLVREPKFIIFDEATSSLDTLSEKLIFDNLLKQHISLLFVTHRIYSILNFDYVYVLDNGRIIEEGVPSQLMYTNGSFSKLLNQTNSATI